MQELDKWVEKAGGRVKTIIERYFNARKGKKRGGVDGEEIGSGERRVKRSKFRKVNREGERLVEFIEERGEVI